MSTLEHASTCPPSAAVRQRRIAFNTLRWSQVSHFRLFSKKRSPSARITSATSTGGRDIYFVTAREAKVFGENATGLKRRDFPAATIDALHKAFRLLTHSSLNTSQAVERIAAEVDQTAEVRELLEFIRQSKRGFIK